MPIPKAELTPRWREPNSKGYYGYQQRATPGGFAGFGSFGGTAEQLGLSPGPNTDLLIISSMRAMFTPEEIAAATARLNALPAATAESQLNAGVDTARAIADRAAAIAAQLRAAGGQGTATADVLTNSPSYQMTGTDWASKLKDPKMLAVGAVALIGVVLLLSPKKKGG